MKKRVLPVILLAAVLAGVTAAAQSLGELARQEEARRKAIASPGKVYTNDSLKRDTSKPVAPPAAPAQGAAPAAADSSPEPPAQEAKKDEPRRDETYWRKRMEGARLALSRAQIFAEALQSRINGLSTDFAARDDPAQRAVIAQEREKALAELDRVKQEIQQLTKGITDIQDEARRASVPPGWLR
jgi:hypothetical protein